MAVILDRNYYVGRLVVCPNCSFQTCADICQCCGYDLRFIRNNQMMNNTASVIPEVVYSPGSTPTPNRQIIASRNMTYETPYSQQPNVVYPQNAQYQPFGQQYAPIIQQTNRAVFFPNCGFQSNVNFCPSCGADIRSILQNVSSPPVRTAPIIRTTPVINVTVQQSTPVNVQQSTPVNVQSSSNSTSTSSSSSNSNTYSGDGCATVMGGLICLAIYIFLCYLDYIGVF